MKEFKDLKVGDELILLYGYSWLNLEYSIFKITDIKREGDNLLDLEGIFDELTHYIYVNGNQVINGIGVYLYNRYGDQVDEYEFIKSFDNLEDCKRYAVKNILKNIKAQEKQLNSVLLWE